MRDRELLELAARAEGHEYPWFEARNGQMQPWNPLTDDGDALRLFLRLPWMCTETSDIGVTVRERGKAGEPTRVLFMCTEWLKDHSGDIRKATRRAIVRAAAEIGRQMS